VVLGPPLPLSNSHSACPSARSDRPRASFSSTPVDDFGGTEGFTKNSDGSLHVNAINSDINSASMDIDASDPVSLPIYSDRALQNQKYDSKDLPSVSSSSNIRKQLNFSDS
jgi:hypothetical protein